MTDNQFYALAMTVIVGIAVATVLAVVSYPGEKPPPAANTILRDCELVGVHVIDNDTVIVCRVMKRNPTPEVETKPEEYL